MSGPYKMKGSPMQRNFGIGSPVRKTTEPVEGGTLPEVEVKEKRTKHKDISLTDNKGKGFNQKIRDGIKAGKVKVMERSDGSTYQQWDVGAQEDFDNAGKTTKRGAETKEE